MSQLTCNKIMTFNLKELNLSSSYFDNIKAGDIVEYHGNPKRVYNNLSDSFKVDILNGYKFTVCCNQYINNLSFNNEKVIRAHFKLIGTGQHTNCTCGACGFNWCFKEDTCNCSLKEPIDPNKEECVIQ